MRIVPHLHPMADTPCASPSDEAEFMSTSLRIFAQYTGFILALTGMWIFGALRLVDFSNGF